MTSEDRTKRSGPPSARRRPRWRAWVGALITVTLVGFVLVLTVERRRALPAGATTVATSRSSTDGQAPIAVGGCADRPGPDNTGAAARLPAATDALTGEIRDVHFATDVSIDQAGTTLTNVSVDGNILVTGDDVVLDHVSARGIAISGASRVIVRRANIGSSPADGIHITSDRGPVHDVTLDHNYIHDPQVPPDAHYDGTQVRGVQRLVIECSNYDLGPWQPMYNAAIYVEDANGGANDVTIRNNWINGGGFALMLAGRDVTVTGNWLGSDSHWGLCDPRGTPVDSPIHVAKNLVSKGGMVSTLCQGGS